MFVAGLAVRSAGPVTAPSIVFLHGGGVSGWSWEPVIEQLSSRFHCLIPDLPEHGRSARVAPFSIEDSARRVGMLIREQARGEVASVVGLSLGGQVALAMLSQASSLVERAVLSGVVVRPVRGRRLLDPLLRLYYPFRNVPILVKLNQRVYEIPDQYTAHFQEDTQRLELAALRHIFAENLSFRLPRGLDHVAVPTLVLVGERERPIVKRSACDIVAALASAEGRLVGGVGHNWSLTAPERFAQVVEAWLTERSLPVGLLPLDC